MTRTRYGVNTRPVARSLIPKSISRPSGSRNDPPEAPSMCPWTTRSLARVKSSKLSGPGADRTTPVASIPAIQGSATHALTRTRVMGWTPSLGGAKDRSINAGIVVAIPRDRTDRTPRNGYRSKTAISVVTVPNFDAATIEAERRLAALVLPVHQKERWCATSDARGRPRQCPKDAQPRVPGKSQSPASSTGTPRGSFWGSSFYSPSSR